MSDQEKDFNKIFEERFAELPEAIQKAVTDASVEKKLRALSAKHKLHLDQWVLLENEIMLTLLGLEDPKEMAKNISKEVGIEKDLAQKLVNDIAIEIFKPIREQMQGTLDSQSIKRETIKTGVAAKGSTVVKKVTPSDTSAYKVGENSVDRNDVQEDPYRESI